MSAAVLCIGTEITRGEIVNTNATWLASRMTGIGFEVTEIASVDDDRPRVVETLRRLARQHEAIACTGGLGPTTDDLTTECAAIAASAPMVRDPASVEAIRDRFRKLGRPMVGSNIKQADFPSGATVMPNAVGTAPGFALQIDRALAVFFPGVPREMHYLWETHAEAMLRAIAPATSHQIRIKTFGQPESTVGQMLDGVEQQFPGVTIGYRASFPEIEVKVLARTQQHATAVQLAERAAAVVQERLGAIVYGRDDVTFMRAMADAVRARGWWLALAESCTGGLVASLLTSEPASDYLRGGVVVYSNEAKTALLGVPAELIDAHGAVSQPVAEAMAMGAARVTGAQIGLGITGIAGPTGGTEDKPVGLVDWAVAWPGGVTSRHRVFYGDRTRIQKMAAYAAMALVRQVALDPGAFEGGAHPAARQTSTVSSTSKAS